MKKAILIGAIIGLLVSMVRFETYEIKVETPVLHNVETENVLYENALTENIITWDAENIITWDAIEE